MVANPKLATLLQYGLQLFSWVGRFYCVGTRRLLKGQGIFLVQYLYTTVSGQQHCLPSSICILILLFPALPTLPSANVRT